MLLIVVLLQNPRSPGPMFSDGLETKMLVSIRLSRERRDWSTWAVDKAIALFVNKIKKNRWAAPSTFLLTPYHILRKQKKN